MSLLKGGNSPKKFVAVVEVVRVQDTDLSRQFLRSLYMNQPWSSLLAKSGRAAL